MVQALHDLGAKEAVMADGPTVAIGVDVGGSGIKAAAVEIATGKLVSDRIRVLTPQPATPEACVRTIARLVARIAKASGTPADALVGIGVPSVVIDGVTLSAANIDQSWIDFPAEAAIAKATKRRVTVVNDADAAGVAEMRFGAGQGRMGAVIVLTLGTGVGSALFSDGRLVPNLELGHMEIRGKDAEKRSAAVARTVRGLSWKAWAQDLDEHLRQIHNLFSPTLFILGGGVSKNADKFIPRLTVPVPVIPAELRNDAGIVGAAIFAAERAGLEVTSAI
jgi:polyphosphate glucokinase